MSKHVSLQTTRPLSITFFYCEDGQEVHWGGPLVNNVGELTLVQMLDLAESSFFSFDVAVSHLQYILRLDKILRDIDTRPRKFDAAFGYLHEDWDFDEIFDLLDAAVGRGRAKYLGHRPYVCCSETSSGGLARGKSYAS